MSNITLVNAHNIDHQHFTTIGDDIRQLSAPLAQQGIIHFSHVRLWQQGGYSLFTTHPSFSTTFVKEKFHKKVFGADATAYQSGMVFIKDIEEHCLFIKNTCIEMGGYKPDFMITEKAGEHTDFYWFGTKASFTHVHSFYLNQIEFIKNYLVYFKAAGSSLLAKIYKNHLQNEEQGCDVTPLVDHDWQKQVGLQCWETMKTIDSQVMLKAKLFCLTPKETVCAMHLCNGLAPKEIAHAMMISPRTVEKHLAQLKMKTRSRNLFHFIAKLLS